MKILIADDSKAMRMIVVRTMRQAGFSGHDITEAEDGRHHAFVAKLYAAEMSGRVTDRALQIFGGLGYSKELPIQSFYRQARLWRIGHGTSEVHRWMIARDILGFSASA